MKATDIAIASIGRDDTGIIIAIVFLFIILFAIFIVIAAKKGKIKPLPPGEEYEDSEWKIGYHTDSVAEFYREKGVGYGRPIGIDYLFINTHLIICPKIEILGIS